MDREEFCIKYCPMPFRGTNRYGNKETDCDCEDSECPFRDVDFAKVKVYKWEETDE